FADFPSDTGSRRFLVSVRFLYDNLPLRHDITVSPDRRIYPGSDYRAGFEIRTAKRCKAIEIHTHPPDRSADAESLAVRRYAFTYLDEGEGIIPQGNESRIPTNGISLLHRIQVTGIDGEKTESMPALRLHYSGFTLNRRDLAAVKGKALPTVPLSHPDIELTDLFGNGLPDILETGATVRYWRNVGN